MSTYANHEATLYLAGNIASALDGESEPATIDRLKRKIRGAIDGLEGRGAFRLICHDETHRLETLERLRKGLSAIEKKYP